MAEVPTDLTVEQGLPVLEKNGFVIADFTPETVTISFYAWKPPDPVEAIERLEPHHRIELTASSANRDMD